MQPSEFRRFWWQWFKCPSCGHKTQGAMSRIEIASDRKQMKLLFLCEACERICALKRPQLNSSVLLFLVGPFFFAPTFFALAALLPTTLGFGQIVLCALGAAAAAYAGILVVGLLTQKYVELDDSAA